MDAATQEAIRLFQKSALKIDKPDERVDRDRPAVTDESSQFPEAERIVDDVLAGKRVFVFWPGTGTVVSIIMLHVLAMGLWWGPTLSACAPWIQANVDNW